MFESYSNSFLKDFNLGQLLGKFGNVRFRSFKSGEFIFREKEAIRNIYFVLSGEISIGNFSDDSAVVALHSCTAGDIIGLDDALSGNRFTKSAFAVITANVVEISKSEFIELTGRNDEFNLWLLKYLGNKITSFG